MFNERLTGPLETAVYWVEHVLKYKNSNHLTPASVRLRWYELFLLDVIATYLAVVGFAFYLVYLLCGKINRKVFLKTGKNGKVLNHLKSE